jgi:glycine/D-amino acid oxidase-like deaminating enzyme
MRRWEEFDQEWSRFWKTQVYHRTGDLCFRANPEDAIIRRTREWYDKHLVQYEMLTPDDVRKEWPVIQIAGIPDVADITTILYEPAAGVLRARRAAQYATVAFEKMGGTVKIGRCKPLQPAGGKLEEIELDTGEKLRAETFVFALGPWMRTFFPLLTDRMRTPLASVCYFSTPPGDQRFTFPNMPSYNFQGTTGWAALPIDSRGFRVRGGARAPQGAAGAGGRGGAGAGRGGGGGAGRGAGGGRAGGGRGAGSLAAGGGRGAGGGGGRGGGGGGGGFGGGGGNADPTTNDPDLSQRYTSQETVDSMRRFLQQRFPLLATMPISETRACHYESSINRDFIIDWHPEMSNVLLAGAGNAEGAKFAPVVGDYISQRAVGIEGDPEVAKRFKVPPMGYAEQAAEAERVAQQRADSVARADSAAAAAAGRGRGG